MPSPAQKERPGRTCRPGLHAWRTFTR